MLCIKILNIRFIFKLFWGRKGSCFPYEGNSVFYFIICRVLFWVFKYIYIYIKQRRRKQLVVSLNPNTVCLLNEPAAVPRKQLPANQHARSDLATMSRLCKHLIITIKLSINLHYCSLFKR